MGKMSSKVSLKRFTQQSLAWLLLLGMTQPMAGAALAADGDVERTLAIVELRTGEEADPLTGKYLAEITSAFRDENPGDIILVDGKTTAEKVRKDRVQVPSALTDDRRAGLADARKKAVDLLDALGHRKVAAHPERRKVVPWHPRCVVAAPGARSFVSSYLAIDVIVLTSFGTCHTF